MIELKGVTKKYRSNDFVAVNNINIKFPSSGFVAICGENGCGKTTLLNIIATNDMDYIGEVIFDELKYRENINFLRTNILSYVYQENHNISYLTVEENLKLYGNDTDINTQLEEYDIPTKGKELFSSLSGGQKQRASFIRGILKNSKVLLVDEPTSSLSEEMEEQIFKELRSLSKNKLVILVSHNLSLVRKNCDIIYHMDNAKIIKEELISINDIEYLDDQVNIPNEYYDISLLDKNKVKNILNKHNKIVINLKKTQCESRNLDYSKNTLENYTKRKRVPFAEICNILKKLYFKNIKNILTPLFINIIFVILLYMLCSLQSFNSDKFTYEALKDFEYVNFDRGYSEDNNTIDYEYIVNDLGAKAILLSATNQRISFDIEISESNYISSITSTAFTNENSVNLLHGQFPDSGIPMITDFTADMIIKYSEEYDNYDDLVKYGYRDNKIEFPISGIIDTDYELYLNELGLLIDEDLMNTFEEKMLNGYSLLYYSFEYINLSSKLENFIISDFDQFITIENNETVELNKCVISEDLALQYHLNIGDNVKFDIGYLQISDIDTISNNLITLSPETYNQYKNRLLFDIEYINVNINSIETLKYLNNHNYEHRSPISNDIIYIVDVIELLNEGFAILLLIIYIIIIAAYFLTENAFMNKISSYIAFKKADGFSNRNMYPVIIFNSIIHTSLLFVTSFPITIVVINLFNNYTSNIFNKRLIFFNTNYILFGWLILITSFTSLIISSITFYKSYNKSIFELLKK